MEILNNIILYYVVSFWIELMLNNKGYRCDTLLPDTYSCIINEL
jgi:hypothetical protein